MVDRTAWAREVGRYVLIVAEISIVQHGLYQGHLPAFKLVFPASCDHRTSVKSPAGCGATTTPNSPTGEASRTVAMRGLDNPLHGRPCDAEFPCDRRRPQTRFEGGEDEPLLSPRHLCGIGLQLCRPFRSGQPAGLLHGHRRSVRQIKPSPPDLSGHGLGETAKLIVVQQTKGVPPGRPEAPAPAEIVLSLRLTACAPYLFPVHLNASPGHIFQPAGKPQSDVRSSHVVGVGRHASAGLTSPLFMRGCPSDQGGVQRRSHSEGTDSPIQRGLSRTLRSSQNGLFRADPCAPPEPAAWVSTIESVGATPLHRSRIPVSSARTAFSCSNSMIHRE